MDHRSYLIDINLEQYFGEEFSGQDKINKRMIDTNKRTQREKFKEYTKELLDTIPIEDSLFEQLSENVTKEALKRIDQDIIFLLDKVWKKIKGQQRNIQFSAKKVKRCIVIKFWKDLIKKAKGKQIN